MEYLDLVKRAKSGNEEAFIRLMELQSDCMYKMAKTILKNEEDVADAMAETVLTCWEKISTLRKNRCILHQSGNHGYCVAEYYRSEFQPSGVFGKRILGRNERTAPDFEQVIVKVDGKEVNASGSFRNFGEEDMPVYQKADGTMEYLMQIDSTEENGLAVKKIQVILENLGTVNKQAEFVSGVKGTWTLDWKLAGTEKEEGLSVNQTIGDTDTVVKSIEITPLSLTIHYDMKTEITGQW